MYYIIGCQAVVNENVQVYNGILLNSTMAGAPNS